MLRISVIAWPISPLDALSMIELLVLTPVIHRVANIVAHTLKLKEVPW
jgi:hypothetical protein